MEHIKKLKILKLWIFSLELCTKRYCSISFNYDVLTNQGNRAAIKDHITIGFGLGYGSSHSYIVCLRWAGFAIQPD